MTCVCIFGLLACWDVRCYVGEYSGDELIHFEGFFFLQAAIAGGFVQFVGVY